LKEIYNQISKNFFNLPNNTQFLYSSTICMLHCDP